MKLYCVDAESQEIVEVHVFVLAVITKIHQVETLLNEVHVHMLMYHVQLSVLYFVSIKSNDTFADDVVIFSVFTFQNTGSILSILLTLADQDHTFHHESVNDRVEVQLAVNIFVKTVELMLVKPHEEVSVTGLFVVQVTVTF